MTGIPVLPARPTARRQRGITLIEVLISVFVLSVGLLGLGTLQFRGLRDAQTSYQRSQAALLAFELTDLMRANRSEAVKGSFVFASAPTAPSTDCGASGATCTTAQLLAYDLYDWYSRVTGRLPGGTAQVECTSPCAIGSPQRITVRWDEGRTGLSDSSYTLSFAP